MLLKTVWIKLTMEGFGERITPWYISRVDGTILYARTARSKSDAKFDVSHMFKTLEEARQATGVHRAFCFIKVSSCEHVEMIKKIHETEGLVCPHCGPGTPLVEFGDEHYCWKNEPQSAQRDQVTLGGRGGCGNYFTIKNKTDLCNSGVCDCGSPVVNHVPGGSYCRKTLDKERKYL